MKKKVLLLIGFYIPTVFASDFNKELYGRMIKSALEQSYKQVQEKSEPCFFSIATLLQRKVITCDMQGYKEQLLQARKQKCSGDYEAVEFSLRDQYKYLFDLHTMATQNLLIKNYGYKKEDLPKI